MRDANGSGLLHGDPDGLNGSELLRGDSAVSNKQVYIGEVSMFTEADPSHLAMVGEQYLAARTSQHEVFHLRLRRVRRGQPAFSRDPVGPQERNIDIDVRQHARRPLPNRGDGAAP